MNAPAPVADRSLEMHSDDSDKAWARQQIMFDGELLNDDCYAAWGRLESQRAGSPRMSIDDVMKQLWIYRAWRRCRGNPLVVARAMRKRGWPDATEQKVKYRIKTMKEQGIITGLSKRPPHDSRLS